MEHMKPLDRNKLGQLILKLRRSRDLSLDSMGELLHVSGRTIRRWEKGEIIPTMDDIINICNEFDISLEEVFEGEIQIDKEVSRKLSKVDTSIENINDRITTTEKTVNDINSGIINLKEHIDKAYNTSGVDNNDLSWLWLLLTVDTSNLYIIRFYKLWNGKIWSNKNIHCVCYLCKFS